MSINLKRYETESIQLAKQLYEIQTSADSKDIKRAIQDLYQKTFKVCQEFEGDCSKIELTPDIIQHYEWLATLFEEVKNLAEDHKVDIGNLSIKSTQRDPQSYSEIPKTVDDAKNLNLRGIRPLTELRSAYSATPQKDRFNQLIAQGYTSIHQVRGDGNCMYRAFYVQYLMNCVKEGQHSPSLKRLIDRIEEIDTTAHPSLAEDKKEILGILNLSYNRKLTKKDGENLLKLIETNSKFDRGCIRLFRQITSDHLRSEYAHPQDFDENVLLGAAPNLEETCREIEGMDREAEAFEVALLSSALDTHTRLASVFAEAKNSSLLESYGDQASRTNIHLLFRPGHYDILYQEPIRASL